MNHCDEAPDPMSSLSISATGILDAQLRMNAAAHNIAAINAAPPVMTSHVDSYPLENGQGVGTVVSTRESVFGVDLVSEAVNLKMGQFALEANARAISAANNTWGSLIDMVDTEKSG